MLGAINNKYFFESFGNSKLSKFLYSDFYYLSIVAFIFLFWGLGQKITDGSMIIWGIAIILVLISALLIIQRDVMPIIPLLFMATCIFSSMEFPDNLWILLIFIGLAFVSLAFHLGFYRLEEFKFGKMFLPLVLFAIAILLGGIGSRFETNSTGKPLGCILLAVLPLLFSVMMLNYIDREKSVTTYIAKAGVYFGLLVVLELTLYYKLNWQIMQEDVYHVPHLGWAVSNSVAAILLMTFPMGFYLFYKAKNKILSFVYLFLGTIEYFAVFPTTSRGALIFGTIEFITALLVTLFVVKGKKRLGYIIAVGVSFIFLIILYFSIKQEIIAWLKYIFHDGMDDSGRFELYREAIACFFEYPIFGVGLGYIGRMPLIDSTGIYQFHDTLLQMLACLGIVGLLAYLYYYFVKLEIIFEKMNVFGLFLLVLFIGYEGYSLINVGTVKGFPDCAWIVALMVALEIEAKQYEPKIYTRIKNMIKKRVQKRQ